MQWSMPLSPSDWVHRFSTWPSNSANRGSRDARTALPYTQIAGSHQEEPGSTAMPAAHSGPEVLRTARTIPPYMQPYAVISTSSSLPGTYLASAPPSRTRCQLPPNDDQAWSRSADEENAAAASGAAPSAAAYAIRRSPATASIAVAPVRPDRLPISATRKPSHSASAARPVRVSLVRR